MTTIRFLTHPSLPITLLAGALAAGCAAAQPVDGAETHGARGAHAAAPAARPATIAAGAAPVASGPATANSSFPDMVVHKSPSCGCCRLWIGHMRSAGFRIDVRDTEQLLSVKDRVGVPPDKRSCHTAQVGAYFVEGHVPAADVKRLLTERPDARGLVLPGMPMGSPGMEMPDGSTQPYTVELVGNDGSSTEFAQH